MIKIFRYFKLTYLRLVRQRDSAHSIAVGSSIGLLIGMIIPIGGQTFIALGSAWFFRANKVAAVIFTFVSNPWTVIFIYPFQIWFGGLITQKTIADSIIEDFITAMEGVKILQWDFSTISGFFDQYGTDIILNFVIGGFILSIPMILINYPIVLKILARHQKNKHARIYKRAVKRHKNLLRLQDEGKLPADFNKWPKI